METKKAKKVLSAEQRKTLAELIVETAGTDYHTQIDDKEAIEETKRSLQTLSGCYEIIYSLCEMIKDLNACL